MVDCPIPYDRTGEHNILNVDYLPISNVPNNWNKSFADVVCERAEEIWDMDKPVRLWWSGGIDSTTALVAFLKTMNSHTDLLIVYMSVESIKENPNMYELLLKLCETGWSGLNVEIQWNDASNIFDFKNFSDGSINVTGEPGDPCWGTYVVEHHIDDLNKPWQDIFEWEDSNLIYREDDYRCDYHRPKFIEFAENFAKKCPFEVKNAFDFTWWVAFALKWQWIATRIYPKIPNPSNWYNLIGFYNCDILQIWSIVNHDLKHKGTWKTYKWPAKEFIYNYNKDADYRDHKVKEKSLPRTVNMSHKNSCNRTIMTDGSFYKKGEYINQENISCWELFNEPVWNKWKKLL